ncbi:MAG: kelch repeat-containing protein [Planctomycetota bacterium JB042]
MLTARRSLALVLLLAGPADLALAQTWTLLAPASSPSARNRHEMATLPNGRVLLFGGRSGGGASLGDSWLWDGSSSAWTQVNVSPSPSPRAGHGMAFDANRNVTVAFSGWSGNNYLPDTWEFDGSSWANVTPSSSPPGRDWPGMAYDPLTQSVLLTGGHDFNDFIAGIGAFDDMWSFDGVAWTQLTPAVKPPRRAGHRMVYDPNSGKVILLGGSTTGVGLYNDMWAWDGTTWTQLHPATLPPPRNYFSLVWDAGRGRVVLHGGNSSGAALTDTWEWDGVDWTQTGTTGPGRWFNGMAYDPSGDRVIHFGGMSSASPVVDDAETRSYVGPSPDWANLGHDLAGAGGAPKLVGTGALAGGSVVSLNLTNAAPNATANLIVGFTNLSAPFFGGTLVPSPNVIAALPSGPTGSLNLLTTFPAGVAPGFPIHVQYWIVDPTGPQGYTASNALVGVTQ